MTYYTYIHTYMYIYMYLPDNTCDWPEAVREVVGDTGRELMLGLPSELKAEKIIFNV